MQTKVIKTSVGKDLYLFYSQKVEDNVRSSFNSVVGMRRLIRAADKAGIDTTEARAEVEWLSKKIEYIDFDNGNYTTRPKQEIEDASGEVRTEAYTKYLLLKHKYAEKGIN